MASLGATLEIPPLWAHTYLISGQPPSHENFIFLYRIKLSGRDKSSRAGILREKIRACLSGMFACFSLLVAPNFHRLSKICKFVSRIILTFEKRRATIRYSVNHLCKVKWRERERTKIVPKVSYSTSLSRNYIWLKPHASKIYITEIYWFQQYPPNVPQISFVCAARKVGKVAWEKLVSPKGVWGVCI